jgi:hypothetical protein
MSAAVLGPERVEGAWTLAEFVDHAVAQRPLWESLVARADLPEDLLARARAVQRPLCLVVLAEDWCGDAVNTVPVMGRLAAETGWDLRVVRRDENLDLMDQHLTGTSRSIPVVIVLDAESGQELGWWGSRPRPLQAWYSTVGRGLEPAERYLHARRWYALDRGRTAVSELLDLIEAATATSAS